METKVNAENTVAGNTPQVVQVSLEDKVKNFILSQSEGQEVWELPLQKIERATGIDNRSETIELVNKLGYYICMGRKGGDSRIQHPKPLKKNTARKGRKLGNPTVKRINPVSQVSNQPIVAVPTLNGTKFIRLIIDGQQINLPASAREITVEKVAA